MFMLTASGFVSSKGVQMREANGNTFATFVLKCKTGYQKETCLVSCTVWGKRGNVVESYVKPGDKLTVSGGVDKVSHIDGKDGEDGVPILNMSVNEFDLAPKPPQHTGTKESDVPF